MRTSTPRNLFTEEGELKFCPYHQEYHPISEFGVCRARKDQLNLYCKAATRTKIAASRLALREYKKSRAKIGAATESATQQQPLFSSRQIARMLRKLSPADRVKEAIRGGAETQTEIARITKLPKDEVGDCIAQALLYEFTIRTEVIDEVRRYFINETGQPRIQHHPVRPREPHSFGVSDIYQSGEPEIRGMSTRYLRNKVG